jgi:hypothetical protein
VFAPISAGTPTPLGSKNPVASSVRPASPSSDVERLDTFHASQVLRASTWGRKSRSVR